MWHGLGKYASARDEVLDRMASDGWANASDGDVESPEGWFALIVNTPAEMPEVAQAFEDEIAEAGADVDALVGNFILAVDSNGFVSVDEYGTAREAQAEYARREDAYSAWLDA